MLRACIHFLLLQHLIDCLFLDFLGDSSLDTLVLFFGDLFSHLAISRVTAQNVRVETGNAGNSNSSDSTHECFPRPAYRRKDHVKDESPDRIEQKAKVNSNHHAKELELCLQAANQKTSKDRVESQDDSGYFIESNQSENLARFNTTRTS